MLFGASFLLALSKKTKYSICQLLAKTHECFVIDRFLPLGGGLARRYPHSLQFAGYAVAFFIHFSNRQLLMAALALLALPLGIHVIVYLTVDNELWSSFRKLALSFKVSMGYENSALLAMRTSDSPTDVFIANIYSSIPRPMAYLTTGRPFQVLGQFLLGIYFLRRLTSRADLNSIVTRKHITLLFVTGLSLSAIYALIKAQTGSPFSLTTQGLFQGVCYHLGAITLALGYVALLYKTTINVIAKPISWLKYLGKMSLTMYLMQTSLCVLLFYGYGFGLMGKVPFVSIILFGISILACQLLFGKWWLGRFKQGPIESMWRMALVRKAKPTTE